MTIEEAKEAAILFNLKFEENMRKKRELEETEQYKLEKFNQAMNFMKNKRSGL